MVLGKQQKKKLHIRRVKPLSGGSINLTARIDTTEGVFFLKANDAFKYPGMFEKEADGLEKLRSTNTITIPRIIKSGEEDGQAYLLLEFIESRPQAVDFWNKFGKSIAALHRNTHERFGFSDDNYIGSLTQSNRQHNKWLDFFVEERIEPQIKLALSAGKLNDTDNKIFQKLFGRLDTLIPDSVPALLHGDLWSGNFLADANGNPCIIDPAVYYGHPEMDLAMTKLFGGFEDEFYEAYQAENPFPPGFEERIVIHNLYPLLVHVNLFGGEYIANVRSILKKFV